MPKLNINFSTSSYEPDRILILATVAVWSEGTEAKRGGKNKRPKPPFGIITIPPPTIDEPFTTLATIAPPEIECCLQNKLIVEGGHPVTSPDDCQHQCQADPSCQVTFARILFSGHLKCVLSQSL